MMLIILILIKIILTFHIGLEQEALYLWHNYKRKKNQFREQLEKVMTEEELAIHNILDNGTTQKNKADAEASACEATLAHWKKQSKYVQGLTKKETTDPNVQRFQAPWHTEALTWSNRGHRTVLSTKNIPQFYADAYENPP